MIFFRSVSSGKKAVGNRPVILTLGNFDGLHLGHQALLRQVKEFAQQSNAASMLLSFYPHPSAVIRNEVRLPLISLAEKFSRLEQLGLDCFCLQRFSKAFSRLSAEAFMQYLFENLNIHKLVLGADAHVGADRTGDINFIRNWLTAQGRNPQETLFVPSFLEQSAKKIGSKQIRSALFAGDLAAVELALGRKYSISGRVISGQKRGRLIGFSTANLKCSHLALPPLGVYNTKLTFCDGSGSYPAVSNLGMRPTVDGTRVLLETHLLDYSGPEIYGREVEVQFYSFVRAEQKFADFDALKQQIKLDVQKAKQYFGLL